MCQKRTVTELNLPPLTLGVQLFIFNCMVKHLRIRYIMKVLDLQSESLGMFVLRSVNVSTCCFSKGVKLQLHM